MVFLSCSNRLNFSKYDIKLVEFFTAVSFLFENKKPRKQRVYGV